MRAGGTASAKKPLNRHGAFSAVSSKYERRMNKELTSRNDLLAAIAPSLECGRIGGGETALCRGGRFGPFSTRISVRPGTRSRVVHRILRRNERAGFFRALNHV